MPFNRYGFAGLLPSRKTIAAVAQRRGAALDALHSWRSLVDEAREIEANATKDAMYAVILCDGDGKK